VNPIYKEKLASYLEQVEKSIDQLLPISTARPAKLHTAIRYTMQAGGKRIRPILLLAASELFPAKADPLAAAVAIECIHTYSLIHDDLPSIDNSELRRGRPSCHARFGEATAILAGDSLLTYAFQLLGTQYAQTPKLAVQLTNELSSASGSERLIGGQMEDIENEGNPINAQTLHYIHENKTGALIVAALKMGLCFCEPTDTQIQQIVTTGYHIGMSFQIIDDILDATSSSEALGKPVGNDEFADKNTYVKLHGIEGARSEAKKHTLAAIQSMEMLGGNNLFLVELIRSMENRIA
jgi:geranylgeranyl diphosphate synthase, type II